MALPAAFVPASPSDPALELTLSLFSPLAKVPIPQLRLPLRGTSVCPTALRVGSLTPAVWLGM